MNKFREVFNSISFYVIFSILWAIPAFGSFQGQVGVEYSSPKSNRQIAIETIVFSTDIPNSYQFGVSGILPYKGGFDPITGSLLSYHGQNFETIDSLVKELKSDHKVEIIGVSKRLCTEGVVTDMFTSSVYDLDDNLIPNTLESPVSSQCQPISSGISFSLKPQVCRNGRIDLKIFMEDTQRVIEEPTIIQNSEGIRTFERVATTRQIGTTMVTPSGFFTLLTGVLFINSENSNDIDSSESKREKRNVVLIVKPTIVNIDDI